MTARCVGRLPPTFDMLMNEHTHAFYGKFATVKSNNPPLNAARGAGQQRSSHRSNANRDPRLARQQGQHRSSRPQGQHSSRSSAKPGTAISSAAKAAPPK